MNAQDTFATIEILLVEDNLADVRLTQEALRDGKVRNTLHVVMDGAAALEFVRREAMGHGVVSPRGVLLHKEGQRVANDDSNRLTMRGRIALDAVR